MATQPQASTSTHRQVRVFTKAPPGCRRIVVATNIAETSVTVEGVVYVVDAGRVKVKAYNPQTGIERLSVVPISRSVEPPLPPASTQELLTGPSVFTGSSKRRVPMSLGC